MRIEEFLIKLNTAPHDIQFSELIALIDSHYQFTPTAFHNGDVLNAAGQNAGSCKIFSFAQLHNFTKEQTLMCFGDYYRVDVLQNPLASDHQNIRNFMCFGWGAIRFLGTALVRQ
jgi:hypothetical protein